MRCRPTLGRFLFFIRVVGLHSVYFYFFIRVVGVRCVYFFIFSVVVGLRLINFYGKWVVVLVRPLSVKLKIAVEKQKSLISEEQDYSFVSNQC